MSVSLAGVLLTPSGGLASNVKLRIIALTTNNLVLKGVETFEVTDSEGNYSFSLADGNFSIEAMYTDHYEYVGDAIVNSATPAPLTLEQLIEYSTPVAPAFTQDTSPEWQDEFNEVLNAPDTINTQEHEQIRDGEAYSAEFKDTYTNSRLDSDVASNELFAGTELTQVGTKVFGFNDNKNNEATIYEQDGTVTNASMAKEVSNLKSGLANHTQSTVFTGTTPNTTTLSSLIVEDDNSQISAEGTSSVTTPNVTLSDTTDIADNTVLQILKKHSATADDATQTTNEFIGSDYINENSLQTSNPQSTYERVLSVTDGITSAVTKTASEAVMSVSNALSTAWDYTSTVGSKIGSLIITNDGNTTKATANVDKFEVTDGDEPVLSIDTVSNTATFAGQVVFTPSQQEELVPRPIGFKEEYQYSATNNILINADWHFTMVTGDKYRRTRDVSFYMDDGEYVDTGPWSIPALLAGVDGAEGDSLYYEYEYAATAAGPWHDNLYTNDKYRRERVVTNGSPTGPGTASGGYWTAPALIAGLDGIDGTEYQIQYEYAISSGGSWHTNYSEGDYWRRERMVSTFGDGTVAYAPWLVYKLIPEAGVDYFNGLNQSTVQLYQRVYAAPGDDSVKPPAPDTELTYQFSTKDIIDPDTGEQLDTISNGWLQYIPDGSEDIYIAVAGAVSANETDIIAPSEWVVALLAARGRDGVNSSYRSVIYRNYPTQPETPSGGSFNVLTEVIPTGWTDNPVTAGPGVVTWASLATYVHIVSSDTWVRIPTLEAPDGWSAPAQWSGTEGVDGISGSYISYVYYSGIIAPARPTNGSYDGQNEITPSGWSDDIDDLGFVPASEVVFVSTARYINNPDGSWTRTINGWSAPVQWTGIPGYSARLIILYQDSEIQPALPSNTALYNFVDGTFITPPNNGWSMEIPNNTGTIWTTNATVSGDALVQSDDIFANEWSTPVHLVVNGSDGDQGIQGPGWYHIYTSAPYWPTDTAATDALTALKNGNPPTIDDVLTYENGPAQSGADWAETKRFNGSSWQAPGVFVDGDMIVTGTILGDRLVGGTITGNEISSFTTITAGSGSQTAGINGDDSSNNTTSQNYRFWAGNEVASQAKFSVDYDGNLIANDAVMDNLTATNINATGNIAASSLQANAVDIVDTLNIRGQAVTVMSIAYGRNSGTGSSMGSMTFNPQGGGMVFTVSGDWHLVDGYFQLDIERSFNNGTFFKVRSLRFGLRDYDGKSEIWAPYSVSWAETAVSGSVTLRVKCANSGLTNTVLTISGGKR